MKQVFMLKKALGPAHVSVEDVPAPMCGSSSILIANRYSLISAGTETASVRRNRRDMVIKALHDPDLRQSVVDMLVTNGVRMTAERVRYEMTKWTSLGYSGAGIAVEVGRNVEGIQSGDLVAYGGEGHAEYVRAARNLCVPVPGGVTARQAAFVAVGSIALQAVRRTEPQVGDIVVVLGLGLVGQLVAQLLRASGARVYGSDLVGERAQLALRLGLERALVSANVAEEVVRSTGGVGADRIVICASGGGSELLKQAARMARDRARICIVGAVEMEVPRQEFYLKELDLVMSRSYGPGRYDRQYEEHGTDYPVGYVRWTEKRNMEEFLRLVGTGAVDVEPLITHEFNVGVADRAYDLLINRPSECLASLLTYDGAPAPPRHGLTARSVTTKTVASTGGNVAVIGCGSFARQFHLPALQRSKGLTLHTLIASTGQSAREMGLRYGARRCGTDVSMVWEDPEVDAVMIFTRDRTHASLAVAALEAGKHVFCEKPLATTAEECERLAAAGQGTDRICMTGFNRRFAPFLLDVKDVLARCQGPKMLHYRVNAGPASRDSWIFDEAHAAGRIVGEACHFMDLFHYLTDAEPLDVTAQALGACPSAARLQDMSATIHFDDGSVATLLYTAEGSPLLGKERLEIFCEGTAIALDDYRRLVVRGSRRLDITRRRVDKGHRAELEHFEAAILGREVPRITLQDGLRAAACCLAAVESARRSASTIVMQPQW